MKFNLDGLSGSYDGKRDVLYLYYKGRDLSYAKEDPENIVTFRSLSDDRLTGYLIYGFKDKVNRGALDTSRFELVFRCLIDKLTKGIWQ